MHPRFGESVTSEDVLSVVLKTAPALCSTDTKLLLLDRYDTGYKIYNHDSIINDRPLALIGMHPAEDISGFSTAYERINQFLNLQVGKFFNISFKDFIEFPNDIVIYMLEAAANMQKKDGIAASDMMDQLEGK